MATLTGTTVKSTYDSLLKLKDNDSLTGSKKIITDGLGNNTPLSISTTEVELAGDLTVTGDLTVSGTVTTIDTETINLADNIITLNSNATGTPSENAGIEVERGDSANVDLRFNESTDRWEFTNDGTNYHQIIIANEFNPTTGTDTDLTTTGATVVDDILITDGVITSHSTRTLTLADLGYSGDQDQDLSDYLLNTTDTFTGTLTVDGNIKATGTRNISSSYDSNNYIRLESNASGGILKGADGGTVTTLVRSYGDSYFNGGNFGIGTDNPGFKLDLGNSENANNFFRLNGLYSDVLFSGNVNAPTGGVGLWNFINTGTNATTRFYVQDANNSDSRLTFDFKGNGGAIDILSGTSSGNVGIGTASPTTNYSRALQINATGNGSTLRLTDAGSGSAVGSGLELLQFGVDSYIINRENGVMRFWNNNSSKMVILANGDVGIGMTNPSAKLDVEGTVKYNTQLSTNDLMGQKAFIGISSGTGAQKFKIYKNSSTSDGYARFKIDRAFDYGNSEQMIQEAIYQRRNTDKNFVFKYDGDTSTSDDVYLEVYELSNGQVEIWLCVDDYAQPVVEVISNPGSSEIFTEPSAGTPTGTLIHSSNPDSETPNWSSHQGAAIFSGNVGIGTDSPNAKLEVLGVNNDVILKLIRGNNTAQYLDFRGYQVASNGNHLVLSADDAKQVWIGHQTAQSQLVVDTDGNVGIGTDSPSSELEVNGVIKATGGGLEVTSGSDRLFEVEDTGYFHLGDLDGLGDEHYIQSTSNGIQAFIGGAEKFRLNSSGVAHFDNDVIAYSTTISDRRLKDNIETIENASETVKKLRGVSYEWNAGNRKGQKEIGLIAQEIEEVLPFLVREHELPLTEGTVEGEIYKTVDYEKLVGLLIEDSKEKDARIERLETLVELMLNNK